MIQLLFILFLSVAAIVCDALFHLWIAEMGRPNMGWLKRIFNRDQGAGDRLKAVFERQAEFEKAPVVDEYDDDHNETGPSEVDVLKDHVKDLRGIVEASDEQVHKLTGDCKNFQRVIAALEREGAANKETIRQVDRVIDAGAVGESLAARVKNTLQSNEIASLSLQNAHQALQEQFQGFRRELEAAARERARLEKKCDDALAQLELAQQSASRAAPLLELLEDNGWERKSGIAGAVKLTGERFARADAADGIGMVLVGGGHK